MKRGITMTWRYDNQNRMLLQIVKKRRKLTLEEIQDLLRYEDGQRYCGHYAIFLNCSEETLGGNGLFEAEQNRGQIPEDAEGIFWTDLVPTVQTHIYALHLNHKQMSAACKAFRRYLLQWISEREGAAST